jgi:zinc and cadmium transporter
VAPWILSLLSVVAVSLVSLLGLATLSLSEARIHRLAAVLVSFAVGALLGDAFIHLIPEAFASAPVGMRSSLLILAGMMIFFIVEKLLRHQHGPLHRHHHPEEGGGKALAAINIVGDAIHNFIDGVLIGASYLASPTLGISTTLAVLFHEIPQELGDFGILIHSGLSIRKAVLLNLASASVAIVGTLVALFAGSIAGTKLVALLVPVTAGGFVYIAAADLIPELQHDRSISGLFVQVSLIALGIAVMALLAVVE